MPFYTAVMFRSFDSNVDIVPVAADVQLVCSPRNVGLIHAALPPSVNFAMMRDDYSRRKFECAPSAVAGGYDRGGG